MFHPAIHQGIQREHITLNPLSQSEFESALTTSQGIICNAGFMLISEALSLGKKILTKPLKGQAEQVANALALEQLGYGQRMNRLCEGQIAAWLEQDVATRVQFPTVTGPLSEWITAREWRTLPDLVKAVWA